MDVIWPALRELMMLCLAASAAEALLGEKSDGVCMVCGLSAAICLSRAIASLAS